jgi:hypothetical protein
MSDLQGPEWQEALADAIKMVGRTGATSIEIGYLNEEAATMADAEWWAKAKYKGAVITTQETHPDPLLAVLELQSRVTKDAACAQCGRRIDWGGRRRRFCWWSMQNGRWEPGCQATSPTSNQGPVSGAT